MNLTEFLLARIAEDEASDTAHADWCEWHDRNGGFPCNCWLGPRWRAECEAKRRMVEMYEFHRSRRDAYRSPRSREIEDEKATQDRLKQEARSRVAEDMLLAVASTYADHPDYDEAWRV